VTKPRAMRFNGMVFNDVPILKRLVGDRSIPAEKPSGPSR
jgi:hypothetical protein